MAQRSFTIDEVSRRVVARMVNWMRMSGYNMSEMARLLDVSTGMISQLIAGERRPSLELVLRIMNVTELTPNELMLSMHDVPKTDDPLQMVRSMSDHHAALGLLIRQVHGALNRGEDGTEVEA